ncbi:diguanylate cyclase [Fulvimarina sp. 2208YS6-2-32]|uniref:diguanylate cyclase n=1 Tax=Fulvimarina uroteuthidis TaxID=3098149 RepID=A0ABU5I765_9HYPH|nr:diguanylate cyclase [Fulvimarina sp. 2208YS6-2-32]MDY8111071.1 diguanylate cyclase [Fulvimarina sp. 2208YS6-2-32]
MVTPDFLLGIINGLGIFALLTMAYGRILQGIQLGWARDLIFGCLFGAGASLAIANTAEFQPGLFIDPRAVMLILAAPFGGSVAAIVAAAITSAVRLWCGGVGAYAGVANIVSTALLGMLITSVLFEENKPKSVQDLLWLGLASNVPLLFILTVPIENANAMFWRAIGPLTVADTLGVLVLGRVLCNERKSFSMRKQLVIEALTDPLTGLPNRRQFEREFDRMIDNARLSQTSLSMLIIDIDLFKRVNDTFGHDIGDKILIEVADAIRKNIRVDDILARFGGEEVIIAMPKTDVAEAARIANRIRSNIERNISYGSRENGNITVSIGIATQRGRNVSFRTLFKAADEALYEAKEKGRNRVAVSSRRSIDHAA